MAALTVWVVANVRRGRSGRRLIAVRTNERAAAALGIDVVVTKLYAFALASAIAALGGILLAFRLSSISYQSFTTSRRSPTSGSPWSVASGTCSARSSGHHGPAGFNQEVSSRRGATSGVGSS
jgi:hypothetical protein